MAPLGESSLGGGWLGGDGASSGTHYFTTVSETVADSTVLVGRTLLATRRVAEAVGAATEVWSRALSATRMVTETVGVVAALPGYYWVAQAIDDHDTAFRARLYDRNRRFKGSLGQLGNRPVLKSTLNGGYHNIVLDLEDGATQNMIAVGDLIELLDATQKYIVFTGIVNDTPTEYAETSTYTIEVDPLTVELDANPFLRNYTAPTEIAQIVRDIVHEVAVGGGHITLDSTTVPDTGATGVFDFDSSYSCLTALEECVKMVGPGTYFFVDELGKLWFQTVDYAKPPTHTLAMTADYATRKRTGPADKVKNYIKVIGGIPAGSNKPVEAVYDVSGGSALGRRALLPAITYPNVIDAPTLQAIAATVGKILSRRVVQYEIELPFLHHSPGERVSLAQPGGATALLYEPATMPMNPEFAGVGGVIQGLPAGSSTPSPLVVQDVEVDGVTQKLVLGDIPYTLDDLQYLIDQMANRAAVQQPSSPPITNIGLGPDGPFAGSPVGGSFGTGGDCACGGSTLFNRGLNDVPFILNGGGNCQVEARAFASIRGAASGPSSFWQLQVKNESDGVVQQSGLIEIPSDGAVHTFAGIAPAAAGVGLPDGLYSAHLSGGTTTAAITESDVQVYLVSAVGGGQAAGSTGFGEPPKPGPHGGPSGYGDVHFDGIAAVHSNITREEVDNLLAYPVDAIGFDPLLGYSPFTLYAWATAGAAAGSSRVVGVDFAVDRAQDVTIHASLSDVRSDLPEPNNGTNVVFEGHLGLYLCLAALDSDGNDLAPSATSPTVTLLVVSGTAGLSADVDFPTAVPGPGRWRASLHAIPTDTGVYFSLFSTSHTIGWSGDVTVGPTPTTTP